MNIKERINKFNQANAPMYIVNHGDGEYSLCLPLCFLPKPYRHFGQEAFNQYAKQIGEPVMEQGAYTHGNGYEWETVFKKAFEKNNDLNKIDFDCEAGGFFCYSEDLSVLESLGSQFRNICLDKEGFAELVSTALKEAVFRKKEEEKLSDTLRGFFMECPKSEAEIRTPDGDIRLTAEQGQQLLNGTLKSIMIGDSEVNAEDFLSQEITHISQDLFHDEHFQLKTKWPEETIEPSISM